MSGNDRRTPRLRRDVVEAARMRVDCAVDARELFLEQHVGSLTGETLVICLLEGVEGAPQFAMRDHGVERNAHLGFEFAVDVHELLLVD
jgi:hypothetical protein